MEFNYKKIIISFFVCLSIAAMYVFLESKKKPDANTLQQGTNVATNGITSSPQPTAPIETIPANLQNMGITDIFYGMITSHVKENSVTEPGQRVTVRVQQNSKYLQVGKAEGVIVVDDPLNKLGNHSLTYGLLYVFYTKFDVKNNWYTILELKVVGNILGGGDE